MNQLVSLRSTVVARSTRGRALVWGATLLAGALAVPGMAAARADAGAGRAPAVVTCTGPTYTVLAGDYWIRIATKNGVTLTALLAANDAKATTVIHPGQIVCLPAGAGTTVPPAGPGVTVKPGGPVVTLPGGVLPIKQFPVQGLCWFSDSWGAARSGGRKHEGVDLIAKSGQKIYAADDGVLTKQYLNAPGSLSGNGWRLTRADGTYFFYAHLSEFAPGLKVGSQVVAGQIIGLVGMTGAAGTPHLHFEVHPGGGAPINPTPTVKAVNGCKVTAIPPQPAPPTPPPSSSDPVTATTAAPTGSAPTTTAAPATTTTAKPTATTAPPPAVPTAPLSLAYSRWTFVTPQTVLDTAGAPMAAGATRTVAVTGARGAMAGVPAVMVRVVAEDATAAGYVKLYACGSAVPDGSVVNYAPGRLNATVVTVPVGATGICVVASSAVELRLDVIAFQGSTGVGVQPLDAVRALDTRATAPLTPGAPITLTPARLGVSATASAVTVSVTLLNASAPGSLTIGPCGGTSWTVAYGAAPSQMLGGVLRLNSSGLCLSATTAVQVVVDVTGVWSGDKALVAVPTKRLFDSRTSTAVGTTQRRVNLSLPAGATRAQLSFVVIGSPSTGALYAWNCSRARPAASVASSAGPATSVTVTMDVTGGGVCVAATNNVQVVIDLLAAG